MNLTISKLFAGALSSLLQPKRETRRQRIEREAREALSDEQRRAYRDRYREGSDRRMAKRARLAAYRARLAAYRDEPAAQPFPKATYDHNAVMKRRAARNSRRAARDHQRESIGRAEAMLFENEDPTIEQFWANQKTA